MEPAETLLVRRHDGIVPRLFACLLCFSVAALSAQDSPKTLKLADKSNVPSADILKPLSKDCPNVTKVGESAKSDYVLEVIKRKEGSNGPWDTGSYTFDLTLFDREGDTIRSLSSTSLGSAAKDLCHAIKTSVLVEVVDIQNLTQTSDTRGDTSGGAAAAVVNGLTGRRTHTDTSSIYVIVNGEHGLLDCYERRTGCSAIGPGKYYGELDGNGIWVNHQIPITHKQVRDHYKIAGSW